MARLREVPYVLNKIGPKEFVRRLLREIAEDGVFNMAAAVAFYWLLALFPFVIFIMSIAPLIPGNAKNRTEARISEWVDTNLPPQATKPVMENVRTIFNRPPPGLLSVGLLATLWAASNGMNATMTALDRCYDISRPRRYFHQRSIAIAMTICMVIVMLLIIILVPVLSIFFNFVDSPRVLGYVPQWAKGGPKFVLDVVRYTISLLLIIILISSIYHFGTSIQRRWRLITPGAIFAVFSVMLLAYGFNKYISVFGAKSYAQTYGTLGGIIILLLLFYLYAVAFLIGAEINSEIDYEVMGAKNDEGLDPLPRIYEPAEMEKFRKQVEARGIFRDKP